MLADVGVLLKRQQQQNVTLFGPINGSVNDEKLPKSSTSATEAVSSAVTSVTEIGSASGHSKKSNAGVIAGVVVGVVVILALILIAGLLLWRRKKRASDKRTAQSNMFETYEDAQLDPYGHTQTAPQDPAFLGTTERQPSTTLSGNYSSVMSATSSDTTPNPSPNMQMHDSKFVSAPLSSASDDTFLSPDGHRLARAAHRPPAAISEILEVTHAHDAGVRLVREELPPMYNPSWEQHDDDTESRPSAASPSSVYSASTAQPFSAASPPQTRSPLPPPRDHKRPL